MSLRAVDLKLGDILIDAGTGIKFKIGGSFVCYCYTCLSFFKSKVQRFSCPKCGTFSNWHFVTLIKELVLTKYG